MRLLILGGTAFLGRAVAAAAVAAGDDVTCAARGESGAVPEGARHVKIDRSIPLAYADLAGDFDAIVDVSSRPSHVRAAVDVLKDRAGHWIYTSSASVYADNATPGATPATAPIQDPAPVDKDDPAEDGYANYGPCKVAAENAVRDAVGEGRAFLCRAGLIVGPEDKSGRFTYWPVRVARGGEVAAPGGPDDAVQWVDVRDLADWYVHVAHNRVAGTFDGIGLPVGRGEFLREVAAGVGADPTWTWIDHEFLAEREINPWAGPTSLPLWLPLPEYAGFLARDTSASVAAGLACRPLAETARDTLEWSRSTGLTDAEFYGNKGAGLTEADETSLLEAWHAAGR